MIDRLDTYFAGPLRALNLRSQRGEVLSANIANADTPHFQARDFNFASALSATTQAKPPIAVARTSERHFAGSGGAALMPTLQYRIPAQPSIDGNTVELDTELAEFSNNALGYQADLTFMNSRIRGLFAAIQGQ
jgi:flagellar basal-body rod protein FlgB